MVSFLSFSFSVRIALDGQREENNMWIAGDRDYREGHCLGKLYSLVVQGLLPPKPRYSFYIPTSTFLSMCFPSLGHDYNLDQCNSFMNKTKSLHAFLASDIFNLSCVYWTETQS